MVNIVRAKRTSVLLCLLLFHVKISRSCACFTVVSWWILHVCGTDLIKNQITKLHGDFSVFFNYICLLWIDVFDLPIFFNILVPVSWPVSNTMDKFSGTMGRRSAPTRHGPIFGIWEIFKSSKSHQFFHHCSICMQFLVWLIDHAETWLSRALYFMGLHISNYMVLSILHLFFRWVENWRCNLRYEGKFSDQSGYGLSQWEALLCNTFSHWPSPFRERSLESCAFIYLYFLLKSLILKVCRFLPVGFQSACQLCLSY